MLCSALIAADKQMSSGFHTNRFCWNVFCILLISEKSGRMRKTADSCWNSPKIGLFGRENMNKGNSLLEGTPWKLLIQLSIPTMLGYLVNRLYSVVDGIIVGRFLGVQSLAAVGATSPLINLFCSLVTGTTVGVGIVVGQYFGQKDEKKVASAIANSMYVNIVFSVILLFAALFFAKPLLLVFNTPEGILSDASAHLQIYMTSIVCMTLFYGVFAIVRSLGDSRTPLYFMILSGFLNIILDFAFILVFRMGVAGAALASALAQTIGTIACLWYVFKTIRYFALTLQNRAVNSITIQRVLTVGLSLGVQFSLTYFATTIVQGIVNGYGEMTIAASTATSKLEVLIQQPLYSWGNSLAAFTAQNYGADQKDRIREAIRINLRTVCHYSCLVLIMIKMHR